MKTVAARLCSLHVLAVVLNLACEGPVPAVPSFADFVCVREAKTRPEGVPIMSPEDAYEYAKTGTTTRFFPNLVDRQKWCLAIAPSTRHGACAKLRTRQGRALARRTRASFAAAVELLPTTDPRVKHVESVGRRVAVQSLLHCVETKELEFVVYQTSGQLERNAIALPGGTIGIEVSLLAMLDDSQLAAVLGHEVAHIQTACFAPDLLGLAGPDAALAEQLRELRAQLGAICLGGLDEAYCDYHGQLFARAAGFEPRAAARLFASEGVLDDRRTAADYTSGDSHPPASMRSTWAWYAANHADKQKRWEWAAEAYYRGRRGSTVNWDGKIPTEVVARCAAPR